MRRLGKFERPVKVAGSSDWNLNNTFTMSVIRSLKHLRTPLGARSYKPSLQDGLAIRGLYAILVITGSKL